MNTNEILPFIFAHKRPVLIAGACAAALIAFWCLVDGFSTWRWQKGVNRDKANINAALQNINSRSGIIQSLEQQQAIEKQAVNQATQNLVNASNATEAAKIETNKSLANLANAKASNVNATVDELERKLDQLDK